MAEKVKRSALIKAAKELNEELGLKPPIDVKVEKEKEIEGVKFPFNEYLEQMIPQAFSMFDPEMDKLSEETIATSKALQPESTETEKPTPNPTSDENAASGASKPVGIPEGAEEVVDLTDLLAKTKKLVDLKALVGEYDVFEPLRDKLDDFAGLSGPRELRPLMEKLLGVEPTKKPQKPAGAKKEKKPKGPGVISTIVGCIEGAGKDGVTKDEILAELIKTFPDREEKSMKNTVNVQVPNRINKEKFPIEKLEDGKYRKAA
jgi:hypothetical protein